LIIGVINYGSGNFLSVWNALERISSKISNIQNPSELKKCSHLILPGVGSFGHAMAKLKELNIIEALQEELLINKKNFLGICVGMQVLATEGHEMGVFKGLDLINGKVNLLQADLPNGILPHMGWNELTGMDNSPLFKNIEYDATFYFVHSYHLVCSENVKAVKSFYGQEFNAAISKDNIHGVQFHPEKSQLNGLKLLKNFLDL